MDSDVWQGSYLDPRKAERPFREVAAAWRETWADLEPKTRVGYEAILRRHLLPRYGAVRVGAMSAEAIQRYVNELAAEKAPNTVRRVYSVLRAVLRVAVDRRYIGTSPCDSIKLPRLTRSRSGKPILTHDEVRELASAIDPHYRLVIYVAAYTGLRAGEIWALRRRHVDLLRGRLHVAEALKEIHSSAGPLDYEKGLVFGRTKTHADRVVSLPRFLQEMLAQHLMQATQGSTVHDALIFTTPRGLPVRHSLFYKRVFKPAVNTALPERLRGLRFHDLRHTCAALSIEQGAHPKEIQARLGHEDIRTTLNVYGHLFPSQEEALADALDAAFLAANERVPLTEPKVAPEAQECSPHA